MTQFALTDAHCSGPRLPCRSFTSLDAPRGRLTLFQDPYSSLDPRRRVGSHIAEGPAIHRLSPRRGREDRIPALVGEIGLAAEHAARFPGQFIGGQRQRLAIARALAPRPDSPSVTAHFLSSNTSPPHEA